MEHEWTQSGRSELRALLSCARMQLDPAARERLATLASAGLDYDLLADAAEQHGLCALFARHSQGVLAPNCPDAVIDRMRRAAHAQAQRSLALSAELLRTLDAFEGAGIAARAIKGAVAAARCYGDLGARAFGDIDLLVAPSQVAAAVRLLRERGYAPHRPLSDAWLPRLVDSDTELLFRHADGSRMVDLHWALLPRGFSFSPDGDELFSAPGAVTIAGRSVPTLSDTADLLFLLLHGIKHDWQGLSWLCDVAELMRNSRDIDWQAVETWSAVRGRRRPISVGLLLASALLQAPVPVPLIERAMRDSVARELAAEIARDLLAPGVARRSPRLRDLSFGRAYFRAMERRSDRLRFLHDAVLRPTMLEWAAVPLPLSMSALHYAVRPVRLALKHGRRLVSRTPGSSE